MELAIRCNVICLIVNEKKKAGERGSQKQHRLEGMKKKSREEGGVAFRSGKGATFPGSRDRVFPVAVLFTSWRRHVFLLHKYPGEFQTAEAGKHGLPMYLCGAGTAYHVLLVLEALKNPAEQSSAVQGILLVSGGLFVRGYWL